MRVSGTVRAFVHDSLTGVNVPRRCCRPGCPDYAVATLTFVYSDSTAVVGPLATAREPHSWDLCVSHAGRITAPRGWELVRHAGPLVAAYPEDDDLVALANAVREGGAADPPPVNGWYPQLGPLGAADPPGYAAPARPQPNGNGRRRGHLRVLPDPSD